jgi:hypothetical protein
VPWMEFFNDPTVMSFERFAPGPLFFGEGP